MNTNTVNVFDLSLPEKLQLVEDLWDDLANNLASRLLWSGLTLTT